MSVSEVSLRYGSSHSVRTLARPLPGWQRGGLEGLRTALTGRPGTEDLAICDCVGRIGGGAALGGV
jgi:hypothetical protein